MRYIEMDAGPDCVAVLLAIIRSQPARSRIDTVGGFSIVAGDTLSVALINVITALAAERDALREAEQPEYWRPIPLPKPPVENENESD